ncbi:arginine repressor [Synechococcus sp. CS-602]|uniref:hypothetical protein n=1 Tax=Synechococcaceae TaxID=1890426 RepID=UPI0008FF3F56|nr:MULTISPECIES: hypothetical protein [Synechococcaceae]MCT4365171.1 arginine repressor [Candidatus Regnicoccus frigidus MAG-AL1]APD49398.1 hypothetical protein BM449_06785 [Synechococcus sp. SynAce01]MCT0203112.1 arginine repressor [Synechococcus sp. CS-603]MCT0204748.1 arginine repressor [Synechococcus sp. CS-602]MCT0246170.1 arginine repressor [Synechococcus sp. CS-601]
MLGIRCGALVVGVSLASSSPPDPLAIDPAWPSPVPLLGLEQALEQTVLRRGVSREDVLDQLGRSLRHRVHLPLLWMLPQRWRLSAAQVPARLRSLAELLEGQLLSPALLHALVDELPILRTGLGREPSALERWRAETIRWGGATLPLPGSLSELMATALTATNAATDFEATVSVATVSGDRGRSPNPPGGLRLRNTGLAFLQSEPCRRRNALLAQAFNRLAANLLTDQAWSLEGCRTGRSLIAALQAQGWTVRARLRSSVASFGLGASLPLATGGWAQVPLALPLRTGLLDPAAAPRPNRPEQRILLPHSSLELELELASCRPAGAAPLLLQYYQGTEGLCGWEGLNDLHRPWQNDRTNGTVRYLDAPFEGEELLELIELCEVVALLHNGIATQQSLSLGGYGSLGFCIDSTALLQQAMRDRCSLFPILLSGLWRERLRGASTQARAMAGTGGRWSDGHARALARHDRALGSLPLDLSIHGEAAIGGASARIGSSAPLSSPFLLRPGG